MINTKELMEDNLIRHIPSGDIKKVAWGGTLKEDDYEAIPLAHEILEQCGFYKQSNKSKLGWTVYCTDFGMKLLVDDMEHPFSNITAYYERHLSIYECVGTRRDLKLHQLQNLYLALTGVALPVNINQ